MNIEKLIINYLSAQLAVPVYGDVPNLGTEAEFVTVEKVGSSDRNHVCKSRLAVQSWSTSRAKASDLNETAKSAMRSAVLLTEVSRCALDTDYNYPDLATKRPRYQALFEIVHDP